ncbi:GIY-YIG nuclease family protein [Hirschia baltica]|uniref:Excinuclease ABC C subunit domain protein n=1 Tax=Hirschia baltica (strain ATCC 49814 / DSM 5838 / IFAM 1418) TaxID=582402 RepID=C6XRX9_HIRBI|nr:GIY-YIG nuclease family protein [Hirschia baltica]ACT60739.1 Excinuclease ABC C subunit domain protein [Hirschia baltica ATCC 49814]
MSYAIYIVASKDQGTIYIGVTNNIARRIWEHKQGVVDSYTKRYAVNRLVYVEWFDNIEAAIKREKQLKNWQRRWKISLIESDNPYWRDLYFDLCPE